MSALYLLVGLCVAVGLADIDSVVLVTLSVATVVSVATKLCKQTRLKGSGELPF